MLVLVDGKKPNMKGIRYLDEIMLGSIFCKFSRIKLPLYFNS